MMFLYFSNRSNRSAYAQAWASMLLFAHCAKANQPAKTTILLGLA
jgi:hypothetical protein